MSFDGTGASQPYLKRLTEGAVGQLLYQFRRQWRDGPRGCLGGFILEEARADIPLLQPLFRRTCARNLIRAGISETVAMKLTGHRTCSVFQRYAIVEEGMLQEAGARLTQEGRSKVTAPRGKVVELTR